MNAIAGGSGGAVYVATGYGDRGGLALYRNGTWSVLSVADGLPGANVRSVFEDSGGRLWVGSEYDGLAVLGEGGALPAESRGRAARRRGQGRGGGRRPVLARDGPGADAGPGAALHGITDRDRDAIAVTGGRGAPAGRGCRGTGPRGRVPRRGRR